MEKQVTHTTAWPRPGEKWCSKFDRPDMIISEIDRIRFQAHKILPPDAYHSRERIHPIPVKYDHRDINSFLARFEKPEIDMEDCITHWVSTATALVHLAFKPESTSMSYLSVRIETPDFPHCIMEFHEINPREPVEFLASLGRKNVRNRLFGVRAEIPDFPATVAGLESLKPGDELRGKINGIMQKFDGDHEQACEALVVLLRNSGLHERDPDNMVQTRENPAATLFMEQVWTPLRSYFRLEADAGMPSPFTSCLDDGEENNLEPG